MEKDWVPIVKKSRKRMTPLRRVLLDVISKSKRPFCLEDIQNILKKRAVCPDFATLCRQINFFLEEEILEQIDIPGRKRFFEKKQKHHHHFICSSCGMQQCLGEEKIHTAIENIISSVEKEGLKIDSHFFSLGGSCRVCTQERERYIIKK